MTRLSNWWNKFTSLTETATVVRMFLTFLVLSAIAFVAIILMTILPTATKALNSALEEAHQNQANAVAAELEQYIDDRRLAIIDVASNALVKGAVLGNTPQSPAFLDYISNIKILGEPADYYILNLLGEPFYGQWEHDEIVQPIFFRRILENKLEYHVAFHESEDQPRMYICVPIQYGKSTEGILIGVLNASPQTILQTQATASEQQVSFGEKGGTIVRSFSSPPVSMFRSTAQLVDYPIEVELFTARDTALQRRNEIVTSVMQAAVLGAIIVFAVLFILGRQLILRPYARLTRTQEVISSALEGIATIGTDGAFTFCNEAFLAITSIPEDKVIGQTWLSIAHPGDPIFISKENPGQKLSVAEAQEQVRIAFLEASRQNSPLTLELQLATPDDHEKYAAFTIVAFENSETGAFAGSHIFAKDITDRKRAALRDRMLSSIVEKSSDVVIVCSPSPGHPVIFVNNAFEHKFGYTFDEVFGLTTRQILEGQNTPSEQVDEITLAMDAKRVLRTQIVNQVKSGGTKTVDANFFPIFDDDTNLQYYAVLERDISDEIRLQHERESLISELQASNSELEEFAYRTSHDLRSPLVSSIGLIKLSRQMLDIGDTSDVASSLELVQNSLQKLDALAEDILTLTKTKYDHASLELVDIQMLVQSAVDKFAYLDGADRLETLIDADLDRSVRLEPVRLNLVLENLISNAIKYQDPLEDHPYLKIGARLTAGQITLTVEDNGLGIPEEQHENLFKMFKRFHPKTSFGSGLGLYMIQKSVNVLGGDIEFEPLNKGVRFIVTIPEAHLDIKEATA